MYRDVCAELRLVKEKLAEMEEKAKIPAKILRPDQLKKLEFPKSTVHWTSETLRISTHLYSLLGGSGYTYLTDVMKYPFPKKRCVQRYLANISLEPGYLYEDMFKMLEPQVSKLPEQARFCALSCDEMSLNPRKEYDPTTQSIIGHPTLPASKALVARRAKVGISERDVLATHALHFMLCGLSLRFKAPVMVHYTDDSIDPTMFAKCIKMIGRRCFDIKLRIVSLGLDMSPTNQAL